MAKRKSSEVPAIGGIQRAEQQRWQAENDLRALRQAEEIRADKARVARAAKLAQQELRALAKIAQPKGGR